MNEELQKIAKKRFQKVAIILGIAAIVNVALLVYSINQELKLKGEIEYLKKENEALKSKLKD